MTRMSRAATMPITTVKFINNCSFNKQDSHFNHFRQFWPWTRTIHEIALIISNKYNALAVKHETTIKCKTNNNGDADVSATKIVGKDNVGSKIVGEEGYDAMKMVEEGADATKITEELDDAAEDQKAVSAQTIAGVGPNEGVASQLCDDKTMDQSPACKVALEETGGTCQMWPPPNARANTAAAQQLFSSQLTNCVK
uniref:Uncharacterized protein n=1 Tax=Romanomermis culicivorax TaxID=13658 RepID=A0A915IL94_ROMCU